MLYFWAKGIIIPEIILRSELVLRNRNFKSRVNHISKDDSAFLHRKCKSERSLDTYIA